MKHFNRFLLLFWFITLWVFIFKATDNFMINNKDWIAMGILACILSFVSFIYLMLKSLDI